MIGYSPLEGPIIDITILTNTGGNGAKKLRTFTKLLVGRSFNLLHQRNPISMKTFIGSLACLSLVTAGAPAPPPVKETQVIIIGGGAAGISAAEELYNKGVDFIVVEAEDNIGGRIKSVKWDDVTVEIGASWMIGASSNEFWGKVEHLNGGMVDAAYNYIVDYDGQEREEISPDVSAPIRQQFNAAFEACKELAVSYHEQVVENPKNFDNLDMSVTDCLEDHGLPKGKHETMEDRVASMMKWSGVDLRFGMDGKHVSMLGSYTEMDLGLSPRRYMVTDERGFDSFLELMAKPFAKNVHMSQKVVSVEQTTEKACLQTKRGDKYCADYIISTLPLATLQERTVDFEPKLSHAKMSSIYEMKSAPLAKVCVQFDDKFWSTEVLMMAEEHIGEYDWAISLDEPKYIVDSDTLCFHVTGKFAKHVEKQDETETRNDIEKWLDHMFPYLEPRPTIVNIVKSDWSVNSNFGGAISVWPQGLTPEEHAELGTPEGRVYFSGDHTHPEFHGTIHGAMLSGLKSAHEIVELVPARAPKGDGDSSSSSSSSSSCEEDTPTYHFLFLVSLVGMISGAFAGLAVQFHYRSQDLKKGAREPLLGSVYPNASTVFAGGNPYFSGIRNSIRSKFSSSQRTQETADDDDDYDDGYDEYDDDEEYSS